MDLSLLAAEFPRSQVEWRAQSMNREGTSALALAYIDARDVMDRLDAACGPANWQTDFSETAKGRVLCRIGININGEWVWKADGAGDTDVEGEKGAISDALKRAAVSWGVGRYLYRIKSPWVPCESRESNGKRYWSRWTADPWAHVKNMGEVVSGLPRVNAQPQAPAVSSPIAQANAFAGRVQAALTALKAQKSLADLGLYWADLNKNERAVAADAAVIRAKDARKAELVDPITADEIPY